MRCNWIPERPISSPSSTTEPFANLPTDFNKISPEGLTAFYEISFSNANIQRLNLESRLDDIHNGSNGFNSNMKVNGATVNLEDKADADGLLQSRGGTDPPARTRKSLGRRG